MQRHRHECLFVVVDVCSAFVVIITIIVVVVVMEYVVGNSNNVSDVG
jgi:hypothetical protein